MAKSWPWRHSIGISLHFLCSFIADERLWQMEVVLCVWSTLGPTDAQPRSFLLSIIPVSFSGQLFHSDSNRNVRSKRKHLTWIQVRHDDITRNQVSRELRPSGAWVNCLLRWQLIRLNYFQFHETSCVGRTNGKIESEDNQWPIDGGSHDQVGSKTTSHVTCLQTIIFWWKLIFFRLDWDETIRFGSDDIIDHGLRETWSGAMALPWHWQLQLL